MHSLKIGKKNAHTGFDTANEGRIYVSFKDGNKIIS